MQGDIPASDWREYLLWLVRRRQRFRITGRSMIPLLNPGDLVLMDAHAYRQTTPQPGHIVVARHPIQPDVRMIKLVQDVTDDGRYVLVSYNPAAGTDSRAFGSVSHDLLCGRITSRAFTAVGEEE